jgi:hypothetical protein
MLLWNVATSGYQRTGSEQALIIDDQLAGHCGNAAFAAALFLMLNTARSGSRRLSRGRAEGSAALTVKFWIALWPHRANT